MKNRIINRVILPLLAVCALGACSSDDEANVAGGDKSEKVYMSVSPVIVSDAVGNPKSRAFVQSSANGFGAHMNSSSSHTLYPYVHNFGFFMNLAATPSVPYTDGYDNLRGVYTYNNPGIGLGQTWEYHLAGGAVEDRIALYKHNGAVRVAGYYPYNAAVTDVTDIPFDVEAVEANGIASVNDYMWLAPVTVDPANSATLTPTLNFRHAMTLLNFTLRSNFSSSLITKSVKIETKDGGSWIPVRGSYDATTGAVSTTTYASSVKLLYNRSVGGAYWAYFAFVMPEIAANPGDNKTLVVTIGFRGGNDGEAEQFSEPFELNIAAIANQNSDYGLRTGFRYDIPVLVDNYTLIANFDSPNIAPWGTPMDIEIEI